jgi:hypothetical protein
MSVCLQSSNSPKNYNTWSACYVVFDDLGSVFLSLLETQFLDAILFLNDLLSSLYWKINSSVLSLLYIVAVVSRTESSEQMTHIGSPARYKTSLPLSTLMNSPHPTPVPETNRSAVAGNVTTRQF